MMFDKRNRIGRVAAVCVAMAVLDGSSLPSTLMAAAPATKPARAADRADTVEHRSEAAKLAFRVPKAWKRLQTSAPEDQVFAFDTKPGAKAPKPTQGKPPPKPQVAQRVSLMLGQPCDRQKDLAAVVEDTRQGIRGQTPDVQFKTDAAAEVHGRAAWTLLYTAKQTYTVVEVRNGKRSERTETIESIRRKTIWLENGTICDVGYECEPAANDAMAKTFDRVVESFQWTAARD